MEHLPTFNEETSPIQAEYICRGPYDLRAPGGFSGYPARHGWNKTAMYETGNFAGKSKDEVASFFQTWLYFGLLCEVLWANRIAVEQDHFVDIDDFGMVVITMKYWPVYHNTWKQVEAQSERLGFQAKAMRIERVKAILQEAQFWIQRFCVDISRKEGLKTNFTPDFWPVPKDTSCAIMALWQTLYTESFTVMGRSMDELRMWRGMHGELITDVMLQRGWCPSEVAMLRRGTDFNGLYYMSTFPRPASKGGHRACSEVACAEENIDEKSYVTIHTTKHCDCYLPTGDSDDPEDLDEIARIEEITGIINTGGIPLITARTDPIHADRARLDVTRWKPGMKYVAISHVWSQGLGNNVHNSLPRCQLLKIQTAVDRLYGESTSTSMPFWMDTLCIPVQQRNRNVRKIAISRINKIYKASDKILILDDGFQEISIQTSWFERTARMIMLSWHRRLWTCVEGTLASDIYFRFSDGNLNLAQITSLPSPEDSLSYTKSLISTVLTLLELQSSLTKPLLSSPEHQTKLSLSDRLQAALRAVEYRNTSKAEDEAVCLAAILGLPIDLILNEPDPAERMRILYASLGTVPLFFLFAPCRKIPKVGYRWAPRSLLAAFRQECETSPLDGSMTRLATISPTGNGLTFKAPGFILLPAKIPLGTHFFSGKFPYAILHASTVETGSVVKNRWLQMRYIPDGATKPPTFSIYADELAIVLNERLTSATGTIGALVHTTWRKDLDRRKPDGEGMVVEKVTAGFLCRVTLTSMFDGAYDEVLKDPVAGKHIQDHKSGAVEVDGVEWCIL